MAAVRCAELTRPTQSGHLADKIDRREAVARRQGGILVDIDARIGGAADDFSRMSLRGREGEIELREWVGVWRCRCGAGWEPQGDVADLRAQGRADQLTQWVAMIEGLAHGLPGYAEALAVQETIEALLAGA